MFSCLRICEKARKQTPKAATMLHISRACLLEYGGYIDGNNIYICLVYIMYSKYTLYLFLTRTGNARGRKPREYVTGLNPGQTTAKTFWFLYICIPVSETSQNGCFCKPDTVLPRRFQMWPKRQIAPAWHIFLRESPFPWNEQCTMVKHIVETRDSTIARKHCSKRPFDVPS